MKTETIPIKREQLLKKVNKIIKTYEDLIQGMYAERQNKEVEYSPWLMNKYTGNKGYINRLYLPA
ncbi:DUF2498 family protein [Xenorhabdus griffiniae]|uniref:DUF2498 family protein n=1 Tax=Xenorhabdus griffiniae TaxID=351672 RepID=A0ABY9XMV3_9GAMM|nr:DUF2498 family protein [Xenorhabdus griffiniae]MBD1227642.1 DUF2498 family protein [Xenorhabdus griffiniae]MBE8586283.1 DUF2498 family protein [Xenorhabdus griffiniae]WMV74282.1 DUF2498 family protein [Xenorhabdus griffiniae]WNH03962.1 DUF2498 family protein [Xenorhabdus griffiniae]